MKKFLALALAFMMIMSLPGHLRCVESAGRSIQLRNTALEQA